MKTVYDSIREGEFKEFSYMRNSLRLLREKSIVVNWWCRQSGKTAFSVKIAVDFAKEKSSDVVFVAFDKAAALHLKRIFAASLKTEDLKTITGEQVFLINGSRVSFVSSRSKAQYLKNADMVIFDEFDHFERFAFVQLLNSLKPQEKLTLKRKIGIALGLVKKTDPQLLIFSSSMKDGANLGVLFSRKKNLPISRVSFGSLTTHDVEKMKKMLGDDWEKEYDSYE